MNRTSFQQAENSNEDLNQRGESLAPEKPTSKNPIAHVTELSRRAMLRVLGNLGLWELAGQITGGALPGPSHVIGSLLTLEGDSEEEITMAAQHADELSTEVIDQARAKEAEGMTGREALMFAIDAAGTANFAMGVRDLLPKSIGPVNIPGTPVGHINATRYLNMLVLSGLKYAASTEQERHHLEAETVSSLKAFGIIGGTIVAAEGLNLDLEKAYEEAAKRHPDPKDKVAIMNLLGSLVSPAATTVGSSSLLRKMSNDLATSEDGKEVDHDLASVSVSHISNISGYLLFGDPPFIAICEKYGFKEGVTWQMNTMWPLALYSLVSATAKMNLILARRQGLEGAEAWKVAVENSIEGIRRNIPILATIMGKSLSNFAKHSTGTDLKWEQDQGGIQSRIGEVMIEKLAGVKDLVFNEKPPLHLVVESHEGIAHNEVPKGVGGSAGGGKAFGGGTGTGALDRLWGQVALSTSGEAAATFGARELNSILEAGRELGSASIGVLEDQWNAFKDIKNKNVAEVIYNRTFDIDRIKGYTGHNLGDVVDVFPFQAGSVPFLTPMFKKAVAGLESAGLGGKQKEIAIFFAIMLFSMMADNYVACKIGLELLPNKPQIPLIAAIQGGSMTAIGNMANVAQFNLEDYPLAVSLAKMHWHVDDVAVGLAWTQAIECLNQFGLMQAPTLKVTTGESHASAEVEREQQMSRRGLFNLFTSG